MVDESWLSERFKEIIQRNKFKVLLELSKESPDFIISTNGKKIGAEVKGDAGSFSLARAVGQLLFGKTVFSLDELWLIIPPFKDLLTPVSKEWFETFRSTGIKIFSLQDDLLVEITEDMVETSARFIRLRSLDSQGRLTLRPRLQELVQLIRGTDEISFVELATKLQITQDAVRGMVSIVARAIPQIERFKKEKKGWVRFNSINYSIIDEEFPNNQFKLPST